MLFWMFGIGVVVGLVIGGGALAVSMKRTARAASVAERRAQRAERLAEVGVMTGGLAHEIRNPLSTIGLNVQLLEESLLEENISEDDANGETKYERDQRLRRIGAIRREVDRLRDILEYFLRFAGAVHLEPARTSLNELVDELADFYHPQAQRAEIRLRVDLSDKELIALVDEHLVKQALLNLLINAVQAMSRVAGPSGKTGASKELILRVEPSKRRPGFGAVQVIDTGPGIEPSRLERVFHPYFTTRSGGSGLGLAVTKRIVESHGGSIDVVSEIGKGTIFTVTLPLADPEEVTTAQMDGETEAHERS